MTAVHMYMHVRRTPMMHMHMYSVQKILVHIAHIHVYANTWAQGVHIIHLVQPVHRAGCCVK